ncbi:MAG: isopeptide-forming domain-containing fimbrial protein [Oscillospiraceae bacterium]|nr:isopeptide-forming domain-containing fimbrial protein [Oscillospiraceae bacterium]
MTKMRRFAAIAAAAAMTACMAMPMMSAFAADTYSITINNPNSGHTYEVYQIFAGDLSEETDGVVLSNIVWGSGQTTHTAGTDAKAVADTLEDEDDVYALVETLTLSATPTDSTNVQTEGKYVIDGLEPGYYLVKDKDGTLGNVYDAYTSYIIQVLGDATATPKSALPEVDKQVYDNADGTAAAGWGETADWTINNTYEGTTQFKLIATIPADADLADYESYKLIFTDTMSKGITFDSIASVKVGETDVTDYQCSATAGQKGDGTTAWTLTVPNVMAYDTDLTDAATVVTVIYNAHLNEEATVNNDDGAVVNKNTVGLQYSNNPNWDADGGTEEDLGKTPEDTVWVSTYQINYTKVDGADASIKLEGVEFTLSRDGAVIPMIYDTNLGAYRPAAATETAETVKTAADGTMNFAGLDAGDYTLHEVAPLPGYNALEADINVKIEATHSEATDGASATADLAKTNADTDIANNKGASLPSTGGIGTTIFYVVGGTLVAGAGVTLIAKKRMKKED